MRLPYELTHLTPFPTKVIFFCEMFPDSKIAENVACAKTKCIDLAHYCKGLLMKSLSNMEHIVVLFDESFNKTSDAHAR